MITVDGEIFRVVDKFINDYENTIKVFCKHIFYDMNFGFIEDNRAENKTVAEAMAIAVPDDFKEIYEVASDIEDIDTLYFVKKYGADNMFSIIERWGQGELVRNNFNVAINKAKGKDKGVTFTYKKIEGIEITEETDEIVTRLYPTGFDGVSLQEKYIYIPNWSEEDYLPFHITREVKFDKAMNEGDLRILAQKKAEEIGLSRLNFSIKVNELANTSLYKNIPDLMKVEVGDIVTIKHSKLDVRAKVKCIKRIHDKVTDNVKLEFGQPLGNFFKNVTSNMDSINVTMPDMTGYKNEMFYYFNGSPIKFAVGREKQLASMRIAVSEVTNLMCHVTINPVIAVAGTLKLRITINNKEIQYAPIIDLQEGNELISFSIPLIAVEAGVTLVAKIWGDFEGQGEIPMNCLHFVIMGQNIAAGLIKIEPFTGAYIEYTVNTLGYEVNQPKITSNIVMEQNKQVPITIKDKINQNINSDGIEIPKYYSKIKIGGNEYAND